MTKFLQAKVFFWSNINVSSFLGKKILNIKMCFCNISATMLNALTITAIMLLPKMHAKMALKGIIKGRSP